MEKTIKRNTQEMDRKCEQKKEYKCVICKYVTDRWWSYNKHLDTKKHMKLSAINSNINMEIVKSDVKYNVPVYKEIVADPIFMSNLGAELDLIDKLTTEMDALREENLVLKMNTDNCFMVNDGYQESSQEFTSIFDSDFSKLFC